MTSPADLARDPRISSNTVEDKPQNYLILSIFSTLCCCLPTGIAAIVYAAQVDSRWTGGDTAGAQESSEKARLWSFVSIGVGLLGGLVYFIGLSMGVVEP